MSKPNPYESPHFINPRRRMAAWKAYLFLNFVLVMIPVTLAFGFYVWLKFDAWQATRSNNGAPVIYHHFFWVAPSGYGAIAAYFFVPNWLLLMIRQ